jgi:hypothetical protein
MSDRPNIRNQKKWLLLHNHVLLDSDSSKLVANSVVAYSNRLTVDIDFVRKRTYPVNVWVEAIRHTMSATKKLGLQIGEGNELGLECVPASGHQLTLASSSLGGTASKVTIHAVYRGSWRDARLSVAWPAVNVDKVTVQLR